jgi:hypothetical protein
MLRTALALTAALGFLVAGSALAAQKATSPEKDMTFEGRVISINLPAQDITVRNMNNGKVHEMKFHVEDLVSVKMDDRIAPLAELKKGEEVTVSYEAKGDTRVVKNVHRHSKTTK